MMHEQIRSKLMTAFNPSHLEVVDESYRHNVPAGTESHFKVVIVSSLFAGQRLLNRHRQIYTLLQDELAATVHALALHTFTEEEWTLLQDKQRHSPPCHGAGISA